MYVFIKICKALWIEYCLKQLQLKHPSSVFHAVMFIHAKISVLLVATVGHLSSWMLWYNAPSMTNTLYDGDLRSAAFMSTVRNCRVRFVMIVSSNWLFFNYKLINIRETIFTTSTDDNVLSKTDFHTNLICQQGRLTLWLVFTKIS